MDTNRQAERLVETYADAILRLSYAYLKNTQDAQDICQTVFVKLLSQPREFQSPEHERAYILRMAVNACKDILRTPWRRRKCGLETCMEIPAPEPPDGSLLAEVNRLPVRYRSVIHLFYYEGYSAAEIGDILNLSTPAVHARLSRARKQLKDLLKEENEREYEG